MKLGINRNAFVRWFHRIVAMLLFFFGSISGSLSNESAKILILPFRVVPCSDEVELTDLRDHLDEIIRSAMGNIGANYSVQPEEAVRDLLKGNQPPSTDEEAKAAARESGSDLVIYGFLAADDAGYRMRGAMWDCRTNRVTVSTDLKVANIHGLPGILQFFISGLVKRLQGTPTLPFYQPQTVGQAGMVQTGRLRTPVNVSKNEGPWRSQDIAGVLTGIAIGDLDGDKKNETVFVGEGGITINRFEGESLRSLTHLAQSPAVYLSAQVEDLDGDGVAELIVCYQVPSGVVSQIIRYMNRNLKLSDSFPNTILAAINDPDDPSNKILVGQRTDVEDMFNGEMVRFQIKDGKAVPDGKLALPAGTFLLSYASGSLGESKEFLKIILNQDQRLMVFGRDNKLLSVVNDRIYGLSRRVRVESGDGPKDIIWPGRLFISDASGDGRKELLVIKSMDRKSEIQALSWDGAYLTKKWNTSTVDGIISDFSIHDFKNNGIQSLVLLLVRSDPFLALSGPRSAVFAYDFIP
ncbi:MAG: VCBS repeat-containing protein [Deltaproteobacteria bacterium]|nr:VCBS repeat-containing protein [Deltaproteobacteria bacterium]